VTPLSILFQDEWLVAIDKPPGFLVHPSDQPKSDDLVAMKILRDQIEKNIRVIHRLDQPTSGVVIFATNCSAARKLRKDFEKRRVKKRYLAMIHGHPSREEWICQAPLKKNPDSPEKPAETFFRVLEKQAQQLAFIEAFPNSGRFHQIRRLPLSGVRSMQRIWRTNGNRNPDASTSKVAGVLPPDNPSQTCD
jgi:tRNA pseudouridine65 synthase